jgi:hypothetical protein
MERDVAEDICINIVVIISKLRILHTPSPCPLPRWGEGDFGGDLVVYFVPVWRGMILPFSL